jgi:Ulp1 family protease
VDIFGKDYLLIPINDAEHWTLFIIVNPSVAATAARHAMEPQDVVDAGAVIEMADPREAWPVMLHLDCLGGYHQNAEPKLRVWLAQESVHRRKRSIAVARRLFSADNMPCFRPDVPRQPDSMLQPWPVMQLLDSIGGYHQNVQPVPSSWLADKWSSRRARSLAIA